MLPRRRLYLRLRGRQRLSGALPTWCKPLRQGLPEHVADSRRRRLRAGCCRGYLLSIWRGFASRLCFGRRLCGWRLVCRSSPWIDKLASCGVWFLLIVIVVHIQLLDCILIVSVPFCDSVIEQNKGRNGGILCPRTSAQEEGRNGRQSYAWEPGRDEAKEATGVGCACRWVCSRVYLRRPELSPRIPLRRCRPVFWLAPLGQTCVDHYT